MTIFILKAENAGVKFLLVFFQTSPVVAAKPSILYSSGITLTLFCSNLMNHTCTYKLSIYLYTVLCLDWLN